MAEKYSEIICALVKHPGTSSLSFYNDSSIDEEIVFCLILVVCNDGEFISRLIKPDEEGELPFNEGQSPDKVKYFVLTKSDNLYQTRFMDMDEIWLESEFCTIISENIEPTES